MSNIKKILRIWPVLLIMVVAVVVLGISIGIIFSPSDSNMQDKNTTVAASSTNISPSPSVALSSQSGDVDSAGSPKASPSSSPAASPTATASASPTPTSAPSPTPTAKATPSPTPTVEVVTVIDNTVHEYEDDSYAQVDAGDTDVSAAASEIIQLVNQQRNNNGLSGLYYDSTLASVAYVRLSEICTNFSHTRPDGTDCFTAYPDGYIYMGENLAEATGIVSASDYAQGCVKYWMESASHRENILNSSYTHTAVAVCIYDGCMYAIQVFGTPAG